MTYPLALRRLIQEFSRYPGIGPKSAERLAFHTLSRRPEEVQQFAEALVGVTRALTSCKRCGGLAEASLCSICDDPRREASRLCIVERPRDIFVFEKAGTFDGLYHVLGGLIAPLSGVGPDDLPLQALVDRVEQDQVEEVILAMNPSTEGETTGLYIADLLSETPARVTRIAYGLPLGGEIEFSDAGTLARALEGRRSLR